jgi:hypothetical protein
MMGEIGEDPRWEVFADLQLYLNKAFPAVYAVSWQSRDTRLLSRLAIRRSH